MTRRLLAPGASIVASIVSWLWLAAPLLAQQPPPSGFVPISQVPRTEQIPAAPFVFIAYGLVWLAVLFYVWTIWRRLGRVEKELQDLQRKTTGRGGK